MCCCTFAQWNVLLPVVQCVCCNQMPGASGRVVCFAIPCACATSPLSSAQFQCLPACLCATPTPSCVQSLDSIASMHKLEYLNLPNLTPTYIWCWSLCVEQLNMLPCHELNLGMMSSRRAQKLHQCMYKYIQIYILYIFRPFLKLCSLFSSPVQNRHKN